jgi:hypothetical protein
VGEDNERESMAEAAEHLKGLEEEFEALAARVEAIEQGGCRAGSL